LPSRLLQVDAGGKRCRYGYQNDAQWGQRPREGPSFEPRSAERGERVLAVHTQVFEVLVPARSLFNRRFAGKRKGRRKGKSSGSASPRSAVRRLGARRKKRECRKCVDRGNFNRRCESSTRTQASWTWGVCRLERKGTENQVICSLAEMARLKGTLH